jgi:hypothetical protein
MIRFPLANRGTVLALLLVPLLAAAGPALAQNDDSSGGTHRRGGGACRPDVERLCSGVEKGGGRIQACLKEHEADLSPACQDAVKNGHMGGRGNGEDNAPPK